MAFACALGGALPADAQTFAQLRTDQIARLQNYVLDAIAPSGLVRDSLVLNPAQSHFHPATPDAAGFALLSLAALDHLGTLSGADQRVVNILNAYNGNTPGVAPTRSADGHFLHFIDLATGADPPGWDDSYSPIGSALIVAGAQFARNHFARSSSPLAGQIDALARQLTDSIDFDAAIHPSLDGRVYLDMTAAGGGAGAATRPWNEYQLVVSLALRQPDNDRALAVRGLWLDADQAPTRTLGSFPTLTDNPSQFAPAFWTQQAQFFNGDFRHDHQFQQLLANHQSADRLYARAILGEPKLYGLTAGVSPAGYQADRILQHPGTVFSPEAVAAWGDTQALLDFYALQPPTSDPRYRYGLVRVSDEQPGWVPSDAGLVDHLFLLFGLVETIDPAFFRDRVFAPLLDGDFNNDGAVDAADYTLWRDNLGTANRLANDPIGGQIGQAQYAVWRAGFTLGSQAAAGVTSVPEPAAWVVVVLAIAAAFTPATFRGDP